MDMDERVRARTGASIESVAEFCKRWDVTELALFGSVLRDDFGLESDIDVMVRFGTQLTPGLLGAVRMEWELGDLFGRRVDLVTREAVENSRNYIRRRAVLDSAQVLYGAR